MSTDITSIKGRYEVERPIPKSRRAEYAESEVWLTAFSGGPKGVMLQVTIQQADGVCAYVQLTKKQADELATACRSL